jgi:hypothetical protein
MGYVVVYAAIVVVVAAATGVLQLLIWLFVAAVQLAVWAAWMLLGLAYSVWLAFTDRAELKRLWSQPVDRQSPVGYRSAMRAMAQPQRSRRAF